MAIAKCTEGGQNPPEFDLDLYSGFDDEPVVSFGLPDECWPDSEYDGAGVFLVKLRDLLEDALSGPDGHLAFDGGEGTHKITSLLREYADKLDESAAEYAKRQPPTDKEGER